MNPIPLTIILSLVLTMNLAISILLLGSPGMGASNRLIVWKGGVRVDCTWRVQGIGPGCPNLFVYL